MLDEFRDRFQNTALGAWQRQVRPSNEVEETAPTVDERGEFGTVEICGPFEQEFAHQRVDRAFPHPVILRSPGAHRNFRAFWAPKTTGCYRLVAVGDTERQLAGVVEGILASYEAHGNINHLDGSNLPARAEVDALLDDLFALLFPGFFGRDHVDELTSRYFAGERVARCLRRLESMIGPVLAVAAPALDTTARGERAHADAMGLLSTLPELRRVLATDVRAAMRGDPAARSAEEVISSYPGITAIATHRLAHRLWTAGVPLLPRMMSELVHSRTGIDIHPGAQIGESFFIDHGTGVVVGETTEIGDRVKLYQGVTLGAHSVDTDKDGRSVKRHPTLEDDVTVYAGATILGGDTIIGTGATIGGNVWLTHSVAGGTTVVLAKPSLRFLAGD